jgi:flagellar basal body-associated protein FliL
MKEQETVKKKKWPKVLLVILIIIALLAGFITFNASKNMKEMNRTLDSGMDTISRYATVTPR